MVLSRDTRERLLTVNLRLVSYLVCIIVLVIPVASRVDARVATECLLSSWSDDLCRGGSIVVEDDSITLEAENDYDDDDDIADAYTILAKAIQSRFRTDDSDADSLDIQSLVSAFRLLSSSHKAFKGLDGAAHEAYQRIRASDEVDLAVTGRAKRSASRTAAVALGLWSCELCELVAYPSRFESPLEGHELLLNMTNYTSLGNSSVDVLVMYDASYQGSAGERHGSIKDLTDDKSIENGVKGRLLIIIGDGLHQDLNQMLKLLEQRPRQLSFRRSETASVQPSLYKVAASILKGIGPTIQSYNTSAIHFTGRSLSGGIATLSAAILDGKIPMPPLPRTKPRLNDNIVETHLNKNDETNGAFDVVSLQGLGKGRASAVVLGAPPCLSANIEVPFVTSILFGDDIIGRVTPDSLDRFLQEDKASNATKSIIGKKLNWMSDAAMMATSNIHAHTFGKDKDQKLVTAGRAYLIRPRRLANQCSIHEIGTQLHGGREALRAALLWQLNDVLLSRSLWKHHQLESYIHGLDRVHLRGIDDTDTED